MSERASPEPIQKQRPEISSELLHVLNRALEKASEDRYQSVSDMIIDLRRVEKWWCDCDCTRNQKLTKKEERFCQEYLIDLNSAQAAIRAGYSKNSAYAIGFENLRKPKILASLQEPLQRLTDKYEITVDRVLRECAYIAFQDPANLFDKNGNLKEIPELEESTRRAIDRIEVSDFAY